MDCDVTLRYVKSYGNLTTGSHRHQPSRNGSIVKLFNK